MKRSPVIQTQAEARASVPTLIMPWPQALGLSPNHRVHWSVQRRAKKALREAWAWQAVQQGAPYMAVQPLEVSLTFVPPDRRARDMDNMLASCKAGLDGLADVLGVDDKHWRLSLSVAKEIGGFVRVEVRSAE